MLLFLFSGVFLFRYAERRFLALLFQEPPRITRFVESSTHSLNLFIPVRASQIE